MEYIKKALFEEMLSFYSATSIYEPANTARVHGLLGHLVRKAYKSIPDNLDDKQKIHCLLQLFYGDWEFHCDDEQYFHSKNLSLVHILDNHQGMPVSLGGVFLYLADKLNLPVYPVNFPTQLILRAEVDNEVAFINPWNGEYIAHKELRTWFEGAMGFGVPMTEEYIGIANEAELIQRFRQLAKQTLIREQLNDEALSYIEYLSMINPQDIYNIRDRGIVLAQMGCLRSAIEDFNAFIKHYPEEPSAVLLQMQLEEMKKDLQNNYHPLH
ncbi:tetratricopeptide repeat protein [[Haemophilus] felis]|nr:tetratricopeptide repeat protein [[Haemophilus] felis]